MKLRLAVLGDSIAAGQGASRREDTIAERLLRGLADAGVDATARVFAVPGARSCGLGDQVDRALDWTPHIAVVVIGANDVTHRTPPEEAARALAETVRRVRNVGGEVVVAPAPDLSAVPYVPPAMRPAVRAASDRLRKRQIAAAVVEGARIADGEASTSGAFGADLSLFSADRFHPSSAGYALIAHGLLPNVIGAAHTIADWGPSADVESAGPDTVPYHPRVNGRVVSQAVVIASGVTADGRREVLGFDVGDSEDGAFWTAFLRSLKARGLGGVQLVISDARREDTMTLDFERS